MKRILIILIAAWVVGTPITQVMSVNGSALDFQIDKIEGADPESYSTGGSTLSYFDVMLMKDGTFTHMITAKNGQFYNRDFEVEYFTSIRFLPIAFIFAQTGYVIRASNEPPTWSG